MEGETKFPCARGTLALVKTNSVSCVGSRQTTLRTSCWALPLWTNCLTVPLIESGSMDSPLVGSVQSLSRLLR